MKKRTIIYDELPDIEFEKSNDDKILELVKVGNHTYCTRLSQEMKKPKTTVSDTLQRLVNSGNFEKIGNRIVKGSNNTNIMIYKRIK